MKFIVITAETILPNEAMLIETVLQNGADYLHLRKPNADEQTLSTLLKNIPEGLHEQIVLHEAFHLTERFKRIGGIHLNKRNPDAPDSFKGRLSRSCHSLEELQQEKNRFAYSFLSPIFNSISKQGYAAAFSDEELIEAKCKGTVNASTIALGGITPEKIEYLHHLGFGGIALLGYIWSNPTPEEIKRSLLSIRSLLLKQRY